MADRKMADRKMADRKMADRKMADRKMADRKMADRKMAMKIALPVAVLALSLTLCACAQRASVNAPKAAPAATPAREERLVIAYEGEDGKTALKLLKSRARVRTSSSQIGELVEEINDVRSDNGYYLFYYINGAMAKSGAGNYLTKTGDRIEWKLIGPRKNKQ